MASNDGKQDIDMKTTLQFETLLKLRHSLYSDDEGRTKVAAKDGYGRIEWSTATRELEEIREAWRHPERELIVSCPTRMVAL